jgi:hypothetical protein
VSDRTATLAEVTALARELSPLDRLRLIETLVATHERDWRTQAPTPRRSLYGLWRDLGPAPSAEEIDEARRDAWGGLPSGAGTPI